MDSVHEGPHAGWTRPPQSQLTHQHVRLQEADVGQDIPGTGAVRTGELAPRQQTLTGNDPGLGQDQQSPGTWTGPAESWDFDGTNRILGLGRDRQNPGLGRNQENPGTWTEPTESWDLDRTNRVLDLDGTNRVLDLDGTSRTVCSITPSGRVQALGFI